MPHLPNKLVAILNKSLEPGVAMNTLAHLSLALGARLGIDTAELIQYVSRDQKKFPGISRMPFIVARGSGAKIAQLVHDAESAGIRWAAFTDSMTIGTWEEQISRTAATDSSALCYYGIVLFGPQEAVSGLTRKFSLWK